MTFLTVKEAAESLRVHPETILRMIRRGDLPAIKCGTVYRVAEDDLRPTRAPKPVASPSVEDTRLVRYAQPEWRRQRSSDSSVGTR